MKTKTNTLIISIAIILSLSVVAAGEIPQALADKNEKKIITTKTVMIKNTTKVSKDF